MCNVNSRSVFSAFFLFLSLVVFDLSADVVPSVNKRCETQAQADIYPTFSQCDPITGVASVSDFSFTYNIELEGNEDIAARFTAPDGEGGTRFYTSTFLYTTDGGEHFVGPCSHRGYPLFCDYLPGTEIEGEHWNVLVGKLDKGNVGPWLFEELRGTELISEGNFDVKTLTITAQSGADQKGLVNQPLPRPLIIKLTSFENKGIEDEVIDALILAPKGAKNAS